MGIISSLISSTLGIPTQSSNVDPAAAASEAMPGVTMPGDGFGAAPAALSEGQKPAGNRSFLGALGSLFGIGVAKVQESVPVLGNIISLGQASVEVPKALFGLFSDDKSALQKVNLAQNALSDVIGIVNPGFDARHDAGQDKANIALYVGQKLGFHPSENVDNLITMGAGGLSAFEKMPSLKGLLGAGAGGMALGDIAGAGGSPDVPTFDA